MKEKLEREYETLREFRIANIKRGEIPASGLAKSIFKLHLSREEISEIICAWQANHQTFLLKVYQNVLENGDLYTIAVVDEIYLDVMKREREVEENQGRK